MSEAFCKDCPRRERIINAMYADAVQAGTMTGQQIQSLEIDIPIDNSVCEGVDKKIEKRTGLKRILGDRVISLCTKPASIHIPEQQSLATDTAQTIQ